MGLASRQPLDALGRRRRRRRRGMTGAALLAAAFAAIASQCQKSDKETAPPPTQAGARVEESARESRAAQSRDTSSGRTRNFDFYLLAMTLAPAFCEDGHGSKRECRELDAESFARTPLTLHGLWPERREPERYPRDCDGPQLRLSADVRARMERLMPGAREGLDKHEWRKHGTCSRLPANVYFSDALDFVEQANAALGDAIAASAGREVEASALRAAANARQAGFGDSLVFVCRNLKGAAAEKRRRPYLYEVRVCVDDDGSDGRPRSLLQCSTVERRDQGCGTRFWIDDV